MPGADSPPEVAVRPVSKLPRSARWAVPAGAVAAVGLAIAGSAIAGAQAAPRLPARSTAQLLAAVAAAPVLPAMQAVVQETANLGLPALPGAPNSGSLSGLSLLSGTHTLEIWYDGPARVRVAIPVPLGETDLRRDGRDAWIWDSRAGQATHYVLPAAAANVPAQGIAPQNVPTPPQLAQQLLAAIGPTTTVGLQPDVMVAGQAAYQLSLAPKDSRSLISQIRIAIDAEYPVPLRVQVFGRGAQRPAIQVGYTSLSFTRPDPSNFAFTPPPGAKVKTIAVPGGFSPAGPLDGLPGASAVPPGEVIMDLGSNGRQVVQLQDGKALPAGIPAPILCGRLRIPVAALKQLTVQLPKGMPRAQRLALLQSLGAGPLGCSPAADSPPAGWYGAPPSQVPAVPFDPIVPGAPAVMGKDWLSVLVLTGAFPGDGSGKRVLGYHGNSGSAAYSSKLTVTFSSEAGPGGPDADLPGLGCALLRAARPVRGAWGSGRLLTTSLISVLLTDTGEVLIGAVQPSVLYADAAQLR
jgi:outer membrane lipoprotein-sorting protein